jgi:hypothetical protein
MYVCMHVCMCVCLCESMCLCMYVCMCVCLCERMCVCMYVVCDLGDVKHNLLKLILLEHVLTVSSLLRWSIAMCVQAGMHNFYFRSKFSKIILSVITCDRYLPVAVLWTYGIDIQFLFFVTSKLCAFSDVYERFFLRTHIPHLPCPCQCFGG